VRAEVEELHSVLDEARAGSSLPDEATACADLHDLVVRTRLDLPQR
jgi:hypothetical protein